MKQGDTQNNTALNAVKWLVAIALLGGGLFANSYYAAEPLSLRLIGWLFVAAIIVAVVLSTSTGARFSNFVKESHIEVRKVVWPSRQETVQTTLIVVAMVFVSSLLLWGIDSVLLWMVGVLTGQRG